MSFGYCTVETADGEVLPSLRGWETAIALSALAHADLLDESMPPAEPQSMFDRAADPESFFDDDDWPLDVSLPAAERAWFSFRSADPARVPAVKLTDNSPWIIDEAECGLLRAGLDEILAGARPRRLSAWVFVRLADRGLQGQDAAAEIERCLESFRQITGAGEHSRGVWSY